MNNPILDVVIVGAGPAGLSSSYYLKKNKITHVVFERGRIAESWQSQRWESFKLNTTNKLNLLPGDQCSMEDADGFATATEFISTLRRYQASNQLPVVENAIVLSIAKREGSEIFDIMVSMHGHIENFRSRQVIVASGIMNKISLPALANTIYPAIRQLHAGEYESADKLPPGATLVVGSAQSGCQITADLLAAGRKVFLSTSKVARVPRRYRGKDVMDWLRQTGFFDRPAGEAKDPGMVGMKAPQLAGGSKTISLQELRAKGATLLGKLRSADGRQIVFEDDLGANMAFADGFSQMVKGMIDDFIQQREIDAPAAVVEQADIPVGQDGHSETITALDLAERGITSIIWATGFTGDLSYLDLPVFDERGKLIHENGIAAVEGLYFLGMPWLRALKSSILFGIVEDAMFISERVRAFREMRIGLPFCP
ncbi:MAG TPA: NAD(P)/FAD-dependent oxidoreductase [Chitinophagaceae bacterium]|nr:NAD(P)/FAD-dependent oxidoreductase [Chitinophagaceae bacterium]